MRIAWWISACAVFMCARVDASNLGRHDSVAIAMSYVVDTQAQRDPHAVSFQTGTQLNPGETVNLGFVHHDAVWVRVLLTNRTSRSEQRALTVPNFHLDSVVLYEEHQTTILGDETPSIGPALGCIAFPISVGAYQTDTLYLRFR